MPTTLTPKQKEAIESWENLCVIASAGTGKTTVLIQKFIHVHQTQQIPIQKILAFTFTEKATQEMQERLAKNDLINNENKMLLQISTIHGFCHQLLSQFGYAVNLKSHFSIFNSSAFTLWLKNEIDEWVQENLKNDDVIFNDIIDLYGIADLQNLVKQFTEQNLLYLDPKEMEVIEENSHKKTLLQNFLKKNYEFQRHLLKKRIESQILCYDDLEILTLDVLKNHPHILEKIQQRYRFILVDEFQDISKIQFQIISQIFEPKLNKIFIVGDPKQSIYGFRGGAVENFLKMETIIQENNGKTIFLEETFRTPQTIQNFFNTVFPKLYSQTQNNLYQRILSKNDFAESHLYTNLLEETKKEKTKDFMEKTLTDIALII